MQKQLIEHINNNFDLAIPPTSSREELYRSLAEYINHLIQNDFQKLVQLLYRIDVNETKLKQLMKDNPDKDAAPIISNLIIERQIQKIKSRQQSREQNMDGIDENEKW